MEVGLVEHGSETLAFEMPTTVRAGEPIQARLHTYGDSCVSFHSTEVETVGTHAVTLTPYDTRQTDSACNLILLHIDHSTELVFENAGSNVITIRGRKLEVVAGREDIAEVSIEIAVLVE